MLDRKSKRELEGSVGTVEEATFQFEPAQIEIGAGYTLQMSQDECRHPVIDVKTYGNVDLQRLRHEIARIFPNAHIRRIEWTPKITVARANRKRPRNGRR